MNVKFKKLFFIFLVSVFVINSLIANNEKEDEYFLKPDEEVVWVINLIDKYNYEALISTRIEVGVCFFLIDKHATDIIVFDPEEEIDILVATFSNLEELKREAEVLSQCVEEGFGEEFLETFKDELYENKVLGMKIEKSDADKLPLEVRIQYIAPTKTSRKRSGHIFLYKNKINIDLDLKKKLDRFYLTLPENYDIWYKEIAPDTEDKVGRRERLMWKASERDIKNIKIHAGTSGDRSHWETLKLFVIGIFIVLISISFGVVKKSDEENKEARYLLLIIFCIIVGGLGLYMRTFPIETHWLLWTIFTLVVITIIYFKGKKIF